MVCSRCTQLWGARVKHLQDGARFAAAASLHGRACGLRRRAGRRSTPARRAARPAGQAKHARDQPAPPPRGRDAAAAPAAGSHESIYIWYMQDHSALFTREDLC